MLHFQEDCDATARNDLWVKVNALRELQPQTQEELRPLFGRALLPSLLRPQGGAFKGELRRDF